MNRNSHSHSHRRHSHRRPHTMLVALLLAALAAATPVLAAADGVVNINQAERAQLMLLPRIGPALAERIVAFREENGPFKNPEDLILVSGIGDKTFASMADHVVVEGKTTLTEKLRTSVAPDGR